MNFQTVTLCYINNESCIFNSGLSGYVRLIVLTKSTKTTETYPLYTEREIVFKAVLNLFSVSAMHYGHSLEFQFIWHLLKEEARVIDRLPYFLFNFRICIARQRYMVRQYITISPAMV